jgi:hypothetical protein
MINCRLCGARVSTLAAECPVCLAPSALMSRRRAARSWKYLVRLGLFALLFAGTCAVLVPASFRLADPMTNVPLGTVPSMSLPVIVVTGTRAEVTLAKYPFRIPTVAKGSSYLVPDGQERAIEKYLRGHQDPRAEGGWSLRVKRIGSSRQRIELYWINDGYRGGGYEASPTAVKPLYQKITGPGFGIVVAAVAFLTNSVLWGSAVCLLRVYRRKRAP